MATYVVIRVTRQERFIRVSIHWMEYYKQRQDWHQDFTDLQEPRENSKKLKLKSLSYDLFEITVTKKQNKTKNNLPLFSMLFFNGGGMAPLCSP